ncbi:MAG: transglycosylase domain-containing protein [Phascolarctobacterium sp.]|nr:transglycosylase domain-containing protein [Phascolarctobacterium sp.]
MMKTIFLIAFLFLGMQAFTDKDTQENKTAPPKEPVRVEQQDKLPKEDEESKALMKSIVLAILPPQEEWPAPVQKFFLALNMEEVINPLREDANWVKLADIPKNMQNALIAIEDHKFYEHDGISPTSILRAILANVSEGEVAQGGSTLTQQFVKNTFLTHEQTMERKIEEAILSVVLEDKYSKDEILEMYLNTTYFGAGATGIHQASKVYFGKHISRLTLEEAAVLAALPYAPSALNPLEHPIECKQRQMLVLNAMAKHGFITQDAADEAKAEYVYLTNGRKM